jgi:hypothetical protein
MHYTTFGRRTGLRVSEYALGTANFGTAPGAGAGPEQARAIFNAFAEAGGTFIDSADHYQGGQAEILLGDLLAADRDQFVLATKYTRGNAGRTRINDTGNSRKTMIRSLEASLKRLGTDYVDVYWAHLPDTITPVDEIVAAFDDLVRAGKILHGGLSNFPAWRVATAATIGGVASGPRRPSLHRSHPRHRPAHHRTAGRVPCRARPCPHRRAVRPVGTGQRGRARHPARDGCRWPRCQPRRRRRAHPPPPCPRDLTAAPAAPQGDGDRLPPRQERHGQWRPPDRRSWSCSRQAGGTHEGEADFRVLPPCPR